MTDPTDATAVELVTANRLIRAYLIDDTFEVARILDRVVETGKPTLTRLTMVLSVLASNAFAANLGRSDAVDEVDRVLAELLRDGD